MSEKSEIIGNSTLGKAATSTRIAVCALGILIDFTNITEL